jgi:hypothetical protein
MNRLRILAITAGLFLAASPVAAQRGLTGEVGLEARGFAHGASFDGQDNHALSVSANPEWFTEWGGGSSRVLISPFVRLDLGDSQRSKIDLREAYWQWFGERIELRAGLAQVFWGVTESQHLVDIVNQTDAAERPDGEAKLGQPMMHATWIGNRAILDVYVMPFFRERTFPGTPGRLRFPVALDSEALPRHERVDLAARAFGTIRALDLGVSGFWGTSREPRLAVSTSGIELSYPTIRQLGMDAQYTRGSWLLKSETIVRGGWGETFLASVNGFEYTFGDLKGTGMDLGLLAEYHYDGREAEQLGGVPIWTTLFRDDLFAGARIAMNDVQSSDLLGGAIIDRDTGETALFVEASRRVGSRFVANLEMRTFHWTDPRGPIYSMENDDYLQVGLTYHF